MIPKNISNKIFKLIGHKTIRYLNPIPYAKSQDKVRQIFNDINKDYVLGPPFALHVSLPFLMAGIWSLVRETMIVHRHVNRLTKEKVAGGVAVLNRCLFCEAAHIDMSGGILPDEQRKIDDWIKSHYQPELDIIQNPPFSKEEAPEIIGTALSFHYLNRMVEIFLTNYPLPLPQFFDWMKPIISSFFRLTAAKHITDIRAAPNLPVKKRDFSKKPTAYTWAEVSPSVFSAFNSFEEDIESTGKSKISQEVRDRISTSLKKWLGEKKGISNAWLEMEVKPYSEAEKAMARLILLAAYQPYKILPLHIKEFQKHFPEDSSLLAACAWGSWQATKRINSWISAPFQNTEVCHIK